MKSFSDSERKLADDARLMLELYLNAKQNENEVVLLEAQNEEAVRKTHRRYFEDLHDLASPSPEPPESELLHSR